MSDSPSAGSRRSFVAWIAGVVAWLAGAFAGSGFRAAHAIAEEPTDLGSLAGTAGWIGEIVLVPYNFAPRGYVFCEGQELAIQGNQALFSLIGTFYGGDGRTTVGLPDTRRIEGEMQKRVGAQRPPFRHVIAVAGTFPPRN